MRAARLDSVDALRGLTVAAMLLVNDPGDWGHVFAPLMHSAWHGCTPTDLVFPLFLFIAGVSLALGLVPRLEAGADAAVLQRELLARSLRIVLVGLALHAVAHVALHTPAFRPLGVLQRIGVCVAVAGVLAIRTRPRTQWGAIVVILLGYWLLMVAGGPLTREGNVASRVDTALLGRYAYEFDAASGRAHDPEGLLATIPAIATTLLGLRAGDWLRHGQWRRLVAAAAVSLALGAAWSLVFPLNKPLWTSSYVLWSGGWAMLALAAAHVAIDRWRWPAWGRSLGLNALAVYAGSWLMVCLLDATGAGRWIYDNAIVRMTPGGGAYVASLAHALAVVALWWSVAAVLARRGVRIKL
jgi:predicted acyltransferase